MRLSILLITSVASVLLTLGFAAGSANEDDGKSVTDEPIGRIVAAAREVDKLVDKQLAAKQIRPNKRTNDATFVRRAYLEIIGRIPTAAETRSFLKKRDTTKRRELIDQLLDSPGFDSHMTNYWTDLLRAKSRLTGGVSGEPYLHFIKESIAKNIPFDRFVHEMMSANGAAHERGNGATGYFLRDRGMPQDNMSNTIRIFLGTRLECAQCHDHPFDRWTQREFFEMAAFTGGLEYRTNLLKTERGREMQQAVRNSRSDYSSEVQRNFRRQVLRPLLAGIAGTGTGLIRLPNDYKYDNAEPRQILTADTMFGPKAELEVRVPDQRRQRRPRRRAKQGRNRGNRLRVPHVGSRAAFADWLTSPSNPRFTTVIANRMWKRAMGLALIEPVDNMKDDSIASNPELMEYLGELMVELRFDLKQFLRVLYNSNAWQRDVFTGEVMAGDPFAFPGPLMRRMSGEQMWDSLLTLVIPDIDSTLKGPVSYRAEAVYASYDRIVESPVEELLEQVADGSFRQNQREMMQEKARRARREVQPLLRELNRSRRRGNDERVKEILAELRKKGINPNRRRGRRDKVPMLRASDLPSPVPPGHFLREFGQSDRDQIQGGHTEANVPQVLTLLNGFVDRNLSEGSSSVIRDVITSARSSDERIRVAYFSILNRAPRSDEMTTWRRDFRRDQSQASRDLVWTLLNSHEFMFIQ